MIINHKQWALLSSALLLLSCSSGSPKKAPAKGAQEPSFNFEGKNLVFVSFDALQAAHVGALGYERPTTPHIDSMAKAGYCFSQCMSVASWTVPASMTWFTGVYPSEHRVTNKYAVYNEKEQKKANLRQLSPETVTLAEILAKNGYITGGFTGNAGVSTVFGYNQGFDTYLHEKQKFGSMDFSVPKALEWLKKNKGKKFFMFLHGYDIHGQSTPSPDYDYRFVDEGYDRKYTGSAQEQETLREEGLEFGPLTLREQDVRFWRAVYDEKIQRTDAKFGAFLAAFKRLGLMEDTVFVLTSDHGTELYEHRRFDHGFTLYDELIHVPLIIKVPKQIKGRLISQRVSSINVMPTILGLLNIKVDKEVGQQLRGRSLVPAFKGKDVGGDVFCETNYRAYTYKRGIIDKDGWKLIYTLEDKGRELYDLNTDPKEMNNLVEKHKKRADELEKRLFSHFKKIGCDLTKNTWKTGLNPVYRSQAVGFKKNK